MARKNNKLLKTFSDSVLHLFNLSRHYKTTSGKDELSKLSWVEFEQQLGEYYRQLGYQVKQEFSQPSDGEVDIELTKFGQISLVHCKHWKCRKVGVKAIREMYAILLEKKADKVIIVTSGEFTLDAQRFAQGKSLQLINGLQLNTMLKQAKLQPEQPKMANQSKCQASD